MGLQLVTSAYGPAALHALRDAVAAAKGDDPLAPVTVVVASNPAGVAARRQLARGAAGPVCGDRPGLAGVTFLTAFRLAEVLGAPTLAASGRRPVSTPVLAAAVRGVLAVEPGVFAPVATHPTTEQRLVATHRELSEASDAALDRIAATSRRAGDVVRIHRAVRTRLMPEWYAEQDLVAAAIAAAATTPAIVAALGSVVVHLPIDLAPSQARLLTTIADVSPVARPVTVVAALTGLQDADRLVVRSLRRLDLDPPPVEPIPTPPVTVTSVSDADEEVRHAIRGVVAAAHLGVALDRMAIAYATRQPYARLVREQLDAAGIASNGTAVATVGASMVGRVLQGLLLLEDRDLRRDDLMALLAAGPFRWNGKPVPSRSWEVLTRRAGVVKGIEQWRSRLALLAEDLRTEMEAAAADADHEWRGVRAQRNLVQLEALTAFVGELSAELGRGRRATSWRALSAWCRELLRRTLGSDRQREGWPDLERRAADKLDEILERLGGLDAIEPNAGLGAFRRTLQLELDAGLGRVGSLGDGVLVGHLAMAEGIELDRLWVLGMAEGTFPSRPREDSLLPDRERVAAGDELDRRADRPGDEHRQLLAAMAATAGEITLLYPRGDLRVTAERPPSRWLPLDVVGQVPSFAHAMRTMPLPATEQEYALRTLVHADASAHPLLAAAPANRSVELVRERASLRFTRFDGNLAGVGVPIPTDRTQVTSASRLEQWARCPFAYFARYLLGVEAVENPELRFEIDALERGTLVHRILERFIAAAVAAPLSPAQTWTDEDRARLDLIATEEIAAVEQRGLTGHELYWRNERRVLGRDLHLFLSVDAALRLEQGQVPTGTEVAFGMAGQPPVEVDLADGTTLRVRGSIDRYDTVPGGFVVLDYKTGRDATIKAERPHEGGTRLQLYLYAAAIRAITAMPEATVESFYWYVTRRGRFRRSGYAVTAELEDKVIDALRQIVAGIAVGMFPQHPTDSTRSSFVPCDYCDPDGLGPREARRRFERMVGAGSLDPYVTLAEPKAAEQLHLTSVDP